MSAELSFNLNFCPVGQGLFTHGDLYFHSKGAPPTPRFHWVYYCGAVNQGALLEKQTTVYHSFNPDRIDLLMLSHFDRDQIWGMRDLLLRKKPRIIVAPYLSLLERLAAISTLQRADVDFARFLISPAAYLRAWAGRDARIVFVRSGGGNLPHQTGGDDSGDNSSWPQLKTGSNHYPQATNGTDQNQLESDPDLRGDRVYQIDGQTPFVVGNRWEFAFYHRPQSEMDPSLRFLLKPAFDLFLNSTKEADEYILLMKRLKMAMSTMCKPGQGNFTTNEISLIVYSGPTCRNAAKSFRESMPWITLTQVESSMPLIPPGHRQTRSPRPGRCAALFTGNITLDDLTFAGIEKHFGKDRINFTSYFQAPRPGSRHSYRTSSPVDLKPDYSIFSTARYDDCYDDSGRHILEQRGENGPLLVNEFQGLETGGFLA